MRGTANHAEFLTQGETGWSIPPLQKTPNPFLLHLLARAFLPGEQTPDAIAARAGDALGRPWYWLRSVAERYIQSTAGGTRLRHRDVVHLIAEDRSYRRAIRRLGHVLSVDHWLTAPEQMQPVIAARSWDLPVIESVAVLADWLWLEPEDVEWFGDLKALGYKTKSTRLRHYHYRVLPKPSGSVRLIESPKRRLKKLQREILTGILDQVPPHSAAHGFVKGRSVKTFAAPHVNRDLVLRMDLRDFFVSIAGARVQTVFRMLGYPEQVANRLGGICTNATPLDAWSRSTPDIDPAELWDLRTKYARPHLPQGAPTSPALANICAFRMDCRLAGLAKSENAEYTRYADDLAFSGDRTFASRAERFATHVAAVVMEEGYAVHHRKTRMMRPGVRQHLAGVVLNRQPNVTRTDFDRLKATLTNCLRFGPDSQNREAHPAFRSHLQGRVAHIAMLNPEKAKRLRALLDRIEW